MDHCSTPMSETIGVTLISPVEIRSADELACEVCGYVTYKGFAPWPIAVHTDDDYEGIVAQWAKRPKARTLVAK